MKKFYNNILKWLNDKVSPAVSRFTQNAYIMALQSCFQLILPLILAGAIANLVGTLRNFIPAIPDISLINQYTFGMIAIAMVFVIPYNILEFKNQNRVKIIGGLTGIICLFALMNPDFEDGMVTFKTNYLGAGGMTVALIFGMLLGWILSVYFKHGLFSKDTSLPAIVVTWFESIVPVFLLTGGCILLGRSVDVFSIIEKGMTPLSGIANSFIGFVLLYFLMSLFYCMGLSAWTVYPIFLVIALQNIALNGELIDKGMAPIYITTVETVFCGWCTMGGCGCTLPLNIMMLRSKSKKLSAVGKAAIFPAIFNINEPLMYGLPVVWNPMIMIPYLLVSIVVPALTYIILTIGLVAIPSRPFAMNYLPQPIATFLTNYDIRGVIFWILLFLLVYAIYLPFFKIYEKQEIKKEQEI